MSRLLPTWAVIGAAVALLLTAQGCASSSEYSDLHDLRSIDKKASETCADLYLEPGFVIEGSKSTTLDEVRALLADTRLGSQDKNLDDDLPGSALAAICVLSGDDVVRAFDGDHVAVYQLDGFLGGGVIDIW